MSLTIKFSVTFLATLIAASMNVATVDLRIMETTDLHSNMMDFDYYKNTAMEKFELVYTTSLVNDAHNEAKDDVLVDNGDLIQGSPLTDCMSARGLKVGNIHPVYKALNTLDYTVGTFDSHELNCGLDHLKNALAGAKFPYVNVNVIDARTKQPMFTPYLTKDTEVVGKDGRKQTLKIGYIGAVPPQIIGWGKVNLSRKVTVNDITETVRKYVPKMREKGADVVVILARPGLSADPYKVMAEDSVYYLSETPGVNAIVSGHAHVVFLDRDFTDIERVGIAKGTLNGVPAIMPDMQDDHLGVVDLQPSNDSGKWQMTQAKVEARPIYDVMNKKSLTTEGSELVETFRADHDVTHQFVNRPIGKSADNMYSYLALVQGDPIVQVVNNVRKAYIEHYIQGDPDLVKLPMPSVAAPFKIGGRKDDPASYMEMEKGQLASRSAADLYLHPNTLIVVEVSGKEVKERLECSAGQFNQIDPNSAKLQSLINWDDLRTYNFDVIDDVSYQIGVTQPTCYGDECRMISASAERIKNPTPNGKPIDPNAIFLVTINNYRAYGGKFAGTGGSHIVFASPDENRLVLVTWIADESKRAGEIHLTADNN